jgi:phosphoserine phosphatase RsbU/P
MMTALPTRVLYFLLFLYVIASMTYFGANAAHLFDGYFDVFKHARAPFDIDWDRQTLKDVNPEAKDVGLANGDVIESVNGQPYSGRSQWVGNAKHESPGTLLRVGVRKPSGSHMSAVVRLRAYEHRGGPVSEWLFLSIIGIWVPLVCLLVGYWVVAARPHDPNAWLVLILLSFPETLVQMNPDNWPGFWLIFLPFWFRVLNLLAPRRCFGLAYTSRNARVSM